jgi:hypothetical protein
MNRLVLPCLGFVVVAACGTNPLGSGSTEPGTNTSPDRDQKYRGSGLVLEDKDGTPELCLGAIADSLPPQCGGPPIEGWDWDSVPGEESAAGATWGSYEVTGFYDGETFTLVDAGPPPERPVDDNPIETPCPEPEGGWEVPDPDFISESDRLRAIKAARQEPDFSGAWLDYIGEASEFSPDENIILNLAFTGDVDQHESQIRELYGGPLCVTRFQHTLDRLLHIQKELTGPVGQDLGLEVLGAGVYEDRNVVELEVIVTDAATQNEIDERYGIGTVTITPALKPVP